MEQYFQRLDEVDNQAAERFDKLEGRLQPGLAPDEALDLVQELIPQQIAILRDLLEGMEELEPPAEVADAHQEAVDALRAFIDLSEDIRDQAAEAESFAEVTELLGSEESVAADQRLVETCQALEQVASDNGITIDLDC